MRTVVLLAALLANVPSSAGAWSLAPTLALGKAVGQGSEDVRLGVASGVHVVVPVGSGVSLGVRASFTYFPVDGELPELTYTGSTEIVDVVPTLRLATATGGGTTVWFAQLGAGVYHASAQVHGASTDPTVTESFGAESAETAFGMSLGAGMTLGDGGTRFEIVPSYEFVFTDVESTQYVLVTVGLVFVR